MEWLLRKYESLHPFGIMSFEVCEKLIDFSEKDEIYVENVLECTGIPIFALLARFILPVAPSLLTHEPFQLAGTIPAWSCCQ
jgi:hypothetical protein